MTNSIGESIIKISKNAYKYIKIKVRIVRIAQAPWRILEREYRKVKLYMNEKLREVLLFKGGADLTLDNIRRCYSEMFQAEKRVADYILEHPREIVDINIAELAKRSGTSDATVIRMCKHIGYSGFYQMKISLASGLKEETGRPERSKPEDVVDFFDKVSRNIEDVAKNISMETLLTCVDLLANAGTVYTIAWGNTGEIAADLAHRLTRIGIRSFVTDVPEYAMRSIGLSGVGDVLVAISHSGEALHVIQALTLAGELGMDTILITDSPESQAAKMAGYVLYTNAKEQPFGDLGGASHVLELLVVDALLYFLKDKETMIAKGDRSEFLLSQYKI